MTDCSTFRIQAPPPAPAESPPPAAATLPAMALATRMARELKKLEKQPPPGIAAWPVGNSITQLQVQMQGPPDTPYELGLFRLTVTVPDRYPYQPPNVQFNTPAYHPNIDAQGRICLDYLNMPPKGAWSPAMDLFKLLVAIRQLLAEPNPKDPLMADIAEEYVSQPEVFRSKARQHVARHATPGATATQPAAAASAAATATAEAAAGAAAGAEAAAGDGYGGSGEAARRPLAQLHHQPEQHQQPPSSSSSKDDPARQAAGALAHQAS